ncbi:MAG: alanine racemase, partial [Defluviitaleaceae bacterium]|nr:alanine racemase [Defluviitaleaceae bacterium]
KHIANSGAILNLPEFSMDIVRAGILIYGLSPDSTIKGAKHLADLGFAPAMSIVSRVAQIKEIPKGESVGYSRGFFTSRNSTTVATIPMGYADGISREMGNRGKVLINGHFADIIGNVCMDNLMVDASFIPKIALGDEVVFCGISGENRILAEEMASWENTINYETVTSLSKRVERIYVDNPKHSINSNQMNRLGFS